jgi:hypothetical protein
VDRLAPILPDDVGHGDSRYYRLGGGLAVQQDVYVRLDVIWRPIPWLPDGNLHGHD